MKVSVAIRTYNQEKYIDQAISSVLNQKVNFEYEIVIGDDFSTDGTRNILIEYERKYPQIIKLLLNEKNLGANLNFLNTINACKGQYIANLEGDDFWTDANKLQKQVDLLNSSSEYKFCFHLVKTKNEFQDNGEEILPPVNMRRDLSFIDFLTDNCISICSVMYVNNSISKWPDWTLRLKMQDWPLYLLLLEKGGKAVFLNELMGVYRVHSGGIWSGTPRSINCLRTIEALKTFKKHFSDKYANFFRRSLYEYFLRSLVEFYNEKKYRLLLIYIFKSLQYKLVYFPFVKVRVGAIDKILEIAYGRSNSIVKKFIKVILLSRNFFSSIKKIGFKRSVEGAWSYLFSKNSGKK